MPVLVSSNLVPSAGAKWPVLEDTYFRGGMRVVANVAARDAIYANAQSRNCLKVGTLVLTADDSKLWRYSATNTWTEYKPKSQYSHVQSVASTVWTVQHNLNCRYFTYSIFDDQGYQIMPDNCRILDNNNLELSFLLAIAGEATFTFNL